MEPRPGFLSLAPDEAERFVAERGGAPFHARIVRRELLERGAEDYASMTALPRALRERLAAELPLYSTRELARTVAADGTTKLLLGLAGGGSVETVHMPSRTPGRGATVCVSTQVGCPVACPFCASGRAGLERNLEPHEIVEQFLRARALGPLSRAVVMGIGEPLLNYANLRAALDVVRAEIGLGARKITVSTVGFPARVRRAAEDDPPFQLAISLHTPDDAQRDVLVPAMAGTPIEEVLAAGDHWFAVTGREVTYEYCLLGGVNDSPAHARALARRLSGRRATVNLIPYNPVEADVFRRPSPESAEAFRRLLQEEGVVATVRWSRGVEVGAACGQLRIRSLPTARARPAEGPG
jgi:23S rRNA (adenine2503-C2)-methyltransferase